MYFLWASFYSLDGALIEADASCESFCEELEQFSFPFWYFSLFFFYLLVAPPEEGNLIDVIQNKEVFFSSFLTDF